MKARVVAWAPALILGLGAVFTVGIDTQRALPLQTDLSEAAPRVVDGYRGVDLTISEGEINAVGVTDYLFREYRPTDDARDEAPGAAPVDSLPRAVPIPFTLYVGYYDRQERGKTIHSPKNCLPGAGWEALTSTTETFDLDGGGQATVNRYLIQREEERALVLYWYQGRGRVESNEYRVKLDLLLDTALRARSDEALVRLVVPVTTTVPDAAALAREAAAAVIPGLWTALPS